MQEPHDKIAELLEACRQGDELAWEALVRRFQGRVYGMAYHYTRHPEEARDLAQIVFIKVYRNLDSCPSAEAFLAWIIRISRNAAVDYLRRRKARPPAEDLPVESLPNLTDATSTPEDLTIAQARKRMLYRAISNLTQFNQEIILLREIEGLSLVEVAACLHVPLGTIKSRLHRARLELADRILALDATVEEGVFPEGAGAR